MSEGLPALLSRVERFLNALGRPYAVIGGAAMIARAKVSAFLRCGCGRTMS